MQIQTIEQNLPKYYPRSSRCQELYVRNSKSAVNPTVGVQKVVCTALIIIAFGIYKVVYARNTLEKLTWLMSKPLVRPIRSNLVISGRCLTGHLKPGVVFLNQ